MSDTKLVHINHIGGDLYVVRQFHPPMVPGTPGNELPEPPTIPGVPDNSLPDTPPPQVPAGMILVLVRTPDGKWKWGTVTSPPVVLPEPPMAPGGPSAQPKG